MWFEFRNPKNIGHLRTHRVGKETTFILATLTLLKAPSNLFMSVLPHSDFEFWMAFGLQGNSGG